MIFSACLIGLEVEPNDPVQTVSLPEQTPMTSTGAATAPAGRTYPKADWTALLQAAGMDLSHKNFQAVQPQGAPPVYADERVAWAGSFDDLSSVRSENVRVEAAAYHGKPVYFAVIGWKEERLSEDQAQVLAMGKWNLVIQTLVICFLLAAGGILAFRNYRSGRGDRQGPRISGWPFSSWA